MKETGLMFKAPLVRAILSGQKTQTRRVVKWSDLQKGLNLGFSGLRAAKTANGWVLESDSRSSSEWRCKPTLCPMGQPGDRIYIRETWQHANFPLGPYQDETPVFYRADYLDDPHGPDGEKSPEGKYRHWSPAIHMPKAAARIWLEVTGVRVERLQDISKEDVAAEGVVIERPRSFAMYGCSAQERDDMLKRAALGQFKVLWESTGGDWAANPWVWVIDFKRIDKP